MGRGVCACVFSSVKCVSEAGSAEGTRQIGPYSRPGHRIRILHLLG